METCFRTTCNNKLLPVQLLLQRCTNTALFLYPAVKFSAVSANWQNQQYKRRQRECVRACVRAASSNAASQKTHHDARPGGSTAGRSHRIAFSRAETQKLTRCSQAAQLFVWKRRVRTVSRGLYQGSVAARPALRVTCASLIGCTADLQH